MLILHYTGMESEAAALARLTDAKSKVSAHYFIGEKGNIMQLVADDKRAWHAGVSCWGGVENINDCSLGVELANKGHEGGCPPFPKAQMEALVMLARHLVRLYVIHPSHVLGHADIAPTRKQDPGERFDWAYVAKSGIGLWHDPKPPAMPLPAAEGEALARPLLAQLGYHLPAGHDVVPVLKAFQRHFRPARVDGLVDDSTLGQLKAILALAEGEAAA